jgi:hypothetical protein
VFTGLTLLVMTLEFVLQLASKPQYFCSFYFYYDLMFPLLLIFDFNFLQKDIYDSLDSKQELYYNAFFVRLYKILRIARILKINKLFMVWQRRRQAEQAKAFVTAAEGDDSADLKEEERLHLLRS